MDDLQLTILLEAIAADDDDAAEAAIIALARQSSKALPAFLELTHSHEPDRRWWAVRGLAAYAAENDDERDQILPALLAALSDDNEATRCIAALALGQLGAASAIPSLTLLLADPSGWVRGAAADALALLGEVALPALGEAIQDEREGVRVRAAYAMYRIGSIKAARWLFPALNDPNPIVHTYAYEALDELGLLNTILVR